MCPPTLLAQTGARVEKPHARPRRPVGSRSRAVALDGSRSGVRSKQPRPGQPEVGSRRVRYFSWRGRENFAMCRGH